MNIISPRGGSWIEDAALARSAARDFSVIAWQKKDPQIPQSIWWNNADWVGFRLVRAVEEHEPLKGVKSKTAFVIKPGPNNPAGTVWIGLSAEGYGIHGTPNPSRVSKTESHGCVRLTNWDVERLARSVKKGTLVAFVATGGPKS